MKADYGRIIQSVGVVAVVVAVEIEIYNQQSIWIIIATIGSLLFAVGTKMVYFSKKRR